MDDDDVCLVATLFQNQGGHVGLELGLHLVKPWFVLWRWVFYCGVVVLVASEILSLELSIWYWDLDCFVKFLVVHGIFGKVVVHFPWFIRAHGLESVVDFSDSNFGFDRVYGGVWLC